MGRARLRPRSQQPASVAVEAPPSSTRNPTEMRCWPWSSALDRTMGGSLLLGSNRGYVPGYPNGVYDHYDFPRRSVYLPVLRSMLYDVFQAFDFPDPSTPGGDPVEHHSGRSAVAALCPQWQAAVGPVEPIRFDPGFAPLIDRFAKGGPRL